MGVEVYFNYSDYANQMEIAFVIDNGNGSRSIARPVELIFQPMEAGTQIEPTMRLHGSFADAFLNAFAEALDKQGVKTDKDAKIEGTLGATRFHLEDLRQLLKLKDKSNG